MSRRHIYLLRKVGGEHDAARVSLDYTRRYWYHLEALASKETDLIPKKQDLTLAQFNAILPNQTIEAIFIIRLFAIFEGVLKDHHSQFHDNDTAPNYASVSWYIERLAFLNRSIISTNIVANVHEVRKYRNSLVHSLPNVPRIPFSDALADLSKFAIKLPEV